MKKPEKKQAKEIKKKPAAAKKAAVKPKKEVKKEAAPKHKKAIAHKVTPVVHPKHVEIKAQKPTETVSLVEKPQIEEKKHEVRHVSFKKNPSKKQYFHGVGGRKSATARVWLSSGAGKYLINGRQMESYALGRTVLTKMAMDPFVVTGTIGKYDVKANVSGGGYAGQVSAVSNAVSRALLVVNPEYRIALKKAGLLTRDPREKERKKYGQKKARKRFQFSKR